MFIQMLQVFLALGINIDGLNDSNRINNKEKMLLQLLQTGEKGLKGCAKPWN